MSEQEHFPPPIAHVAAMAPYTLADLSAPEGKRLVSLAQNESRRLPSPLAIEAAVQAMKNSHLYPDPDWQELREKIAHVHGISAGNILCGAGSMELIACLGRAYLGPGASLVTTQFAYAFARTVTQFTDCELIVAREKDYRVDTSLLLSMIRPDTRIVFITNPGNPTGTRISNRDLRDFHARLPRSVLLIVDEAYGEFTDGEEDPLFDLADFGNCGILRTFSKAYGLAGMRVGWGVFPSAIAREIRKVLNPNNVSIASQAAAAAAMDDQIYMRETCRITAQTRDRFVRSLNDLSIKAIPSSTNFVLIEAGTEEKAANLLATLKEESVLMRGMAGYGLAQCVRATIGPQDEMDLAVRLITDWKKNLDNGRVKA